jgi:hypothetical protein
MRGGNGNNIELFTATLIYGVAFKLRLMLISLILEFMLNWVGDSL